MVSRTFSCGSLQGVVTAVLDSITGCSEAGLDKSDKVKLKNPKELANIAEVQIGPINHFNRPQKPLVDAKSYR